MEVDDIISYHDLVTAEKAALQFAQIRQDHVGRSVDLGNCDHRNTAPQTLRLTRDACDKAGVRGE